MGRGIKIENCMRAFRKCVFALLGFNALYYQQHLKQNNKSTNPIISNTLPSANFL